MFMVMFMIYTYTSLDYIMKLIIKTNLNLIYY